jgi:hypothetical protein
MTTVKKKRSSKRRSSKRRSSKKPAPIRPNYTAPKRDFEYEGDDEGEGEGESLKSQIRREMIGKLASEWNELNSRREARSFRSREERDEENEYLYERAEEHAWEAMTHWAEDNEVELDWNDSGRTSWPPEARAEFDELLKKELGERSGVEGEDENTNLRMQVIEELIGELGGRMMRPYEHWNEEEQYREYAERDSDDDRDDY